MSWLDDLFGALGSAGTDLWTALFGGGAPSGPFGGGGYPTPYPYLNFGTTPSGGGPANWNQYLAGASGPFNAGPSFGQAGGIFGSLGNLLMPGNPLGGLILGGGLGLEGYQATQMNDRLNKIAQMAQNPAYYQKFMQPLSKQFTTAIEEPVKSEAAQMGLATSPGMMTTLLANALAPYQLDEQQLAQQEATQALDYSTLQALSDPYQQFLQSLGVGP